MNPGRQGGGRRGEAWRWVMWGGATALLLLPWVAMRFTTEVDWSAFDFLIFAVMLACACGAFELAARLARSWVYRAAAGVAVVAAFLLVWINLAVGIVGSEANAANLMYLGVLAIGLAGAVVARGQAAGMARALLATAIAQALTALVVLVGGLGLGAFVLSTGFIAPWLLSAWLFRAAAAGQVAARLRS
jgi:hypothetical protein